MNGSGHVKAELAMPDEAEVTAVCDVYAPRLDRGVTATKAKGYRDYRELLADKNVDAVIISTPDHWHARIAIDAMRAGKDVDVEKPMARTIEEAKEMVRVAKETGRVLAVDSEHMAHGIWKVARQVVDAGILGKLTWSQTGRSRNARERPGITRSTPTRARRTSIGTSGSGRRRKSRSAKSAFSAGAGSGSTAGGSSRTSTTITSRH